MVGDSEDRALADGGEAEVFEGPDDVPGWGVNGEFGH